MELPVHYDSTHWTIRKKVRNAYVKQQDGLCWYCEASLLGEPHVRVATNSVKESLFPKGFFGWPIHLHHDRKSGLTIGAVHAKCNAVLWQYHGE